MYEDISGSWVLRFFCAGAGLRFPSAPYPPYLAGGRAVIFSDDREAMLQIFLSSLML